MEEWEIQEIEEMNGGKRRMMEMFPRDGKGLGIWYESRETCDNRRIQWDIVEKEGEDMRWKVVLNSDDTPFPAYFLSAFSLSSVLIIIWTSQFTKGNNTHTNITYISYHSFISTKWYLPPHLVQWRFSRTSGAFPLTTRRETNMENQRKRRVTITFFPLPSPNGRRNFIRTHYSHSGQIGKE